MKSQLIALAGGIALALSAPAAIADCGADHTAQAQVPSAKMTDTNVTSNADTQGQQTSQPATRMEGGTSAAQRSSADAGANTNLGDASKSAGGASESAKMEDKPGSPAEPPAKAIDQGTGAKMSTDQSAQAPSSGCPEKAG